MVTEKKLGLGLQGGGSYAAFGWGVLDRLLEDARFDIAAISGTSGGAINAAVLADGFSQGGGREGARRALHRFWQALSSANMFSPLRHAFRLPDRNRFGSNVPRLPSDADNGAVLPPQMTPVSMNPLHGLLSSLIDFERVRRCEEIRIYVPATNVRTGKANIFVRDELDARMLAASACLPQLFAAVEIDGEAYWDGSFVGNPALSPLVGGAHADDILILQNNPIVRSKLPLSPADIVNRASEISFNVGFMFELRAIAHAGALADEEHPDRRRASRVRLHMISGNELLSNLDISSKFNLEWPFILQLHEAGRKAAGDWLASNASQIGVRSTIESHLVDHPERHAAGGR